MFADSCSWCVVCCVVVCCRLTTVRGLLSVVYWVCVSLFVVRCVLFVVVRCACVVGRCLLFVM